jgi:hypothetical protein
MRIKKIPIPIYFGTLILIETVDLQVIAKKYGIIKDVSSCQAITFQNTNSELFECIMAYHEGSRNKDIAHECVHFISNLYINRGVQMCPFNDEPQAYLMGWVFEQNERFINNK